MEYIYRETESYLYTYMGKRDLEELMHGDGERGGQGCRAERAALG
jgi:hypothetical protein